MSQVFKRRNTSEKLKTMGDHDEFLNRITKSLYYSKLPITDRLSLPVTEFAAELFSEVKSGCSLERLDVEEASRISRNACVSPCSFVLALLYLERLKDCNPEYLYKVAPSELFLVSLMVASKFLHDDGEEDEVFNMEWAKSGDLSVGQMNRLEKEFLNAINWAIYVSDEDFWKRLCDLERDVAYKEIRKRQWCSYTEITCLLDTLYLAKVIQTIINISSVCLATYAAGIVTLLGSALVASHVPGTLLTPASMINTQMNLPQPLPESTQHLVANSTADEAIYSTDDADADVLSSLVAWLARSNVDSKENEFDKPGTFVTNSQSLRSTWEDVIVELNWKEALNSDSDQPNNGWRYYTGYLGKNSYV